jgi:hypothetical protein
MKRRSFIGLLLGAAAAITLRAATTVDEGIGTGTWTALSPDFLPYEGISEQISYITRRSILSQAYSQIYNTSPVLSAWRMLEEDENETT